MSEASTADRDDAGASADGDAGASADGEVTTRPDAVRVERTNRWRGGLAAALVLLVAGLVAQRATFLLAAVVPLVYLAYGSLSGADVPELRAVRQVEPTTVPPGTPVAVKLELRNESDEYVADLRAVDGVPEDLAVTSGTPRAGATLSPGEVCAVEYTMVARRGTHQFDPATVSVRGVGGGAVARTTVVPEGPDGIDCRLDADAPPLANHGGTYVGEMTADDPGEGLTFHSTREYRHGDSADRINWRYYAKRNELATVNYERRVSTAVVVVLDAREPARVVAGPGRPTAVELGGYAATHAVSSLLGGGHDVGVAVLGLDGPGPAGLYWLPPEAGAGVQARALELFERASKAPPVEADDGDGRASDRETRAQMRQVSALAPAGTQVALFSPLLDDGAVDAVEAWRARDLPVVVVSPDVVSSNTVSGQFEQVARRSRLARCQAAGARPFDWQRGTPLPLALEYAFAAATRSGDDVVTPRTGGGG